MSNPFWNTESDLGRVGWLLVLGITGSIALGVVLGSFGLATDSIVVGAWLFNLLPSWYIAQAARRRGKRAMLYGVISAMGGAIAASAWLRVQDQWSLLGRRQPGHRDEA